MRAVRLAATLLSGLPLLALALPPAADAQRTSDLYELEELAPNVYRFSAFFYTNLFVVTPEGVIATDPISPMVAQLCSRAIRSVTDLPVRYVIYSHDHTDHISGGAAFPEATFIAHENARKAILERGNDTIVPPDVTFEDRYTLEFGGRVVELYYFGENHSKSNVGILLPQDKILMLVDLVRPGSVPFRDLPGTDLREFLRTLEEVKKLDFDWLVYGHGPAGPSHWIDKYLIYFDDLIAAVKTAEKDIPYSRFFPQEGGGNARSILDTRIDEVARRVVEVMRRDYGHWGGYDDWALLNAKKVVLYLIMEG